MKVKTSVTLSEEILARIEENLDQSGNRSQFIETAVLYYLKQCQKSLRDTQDLSILNKNHIHLNREAEETLEFQNIYP